MGSLAGSAFSAREKRQVHLTVAYPSYLLARTDVRGEVRMKPTPPFGDEADAEWVPVPLRRNCTFVLGSDDEEPAAERAHAGAEPRGADAGSPRSKARIWRDQVSRHDARCFSARAAPQEIPLRAT